MSMKNDAGNRSGATQSGYTTCDSRRLSHQSAAPPLLWMFLSFGAGIILTSTWNRIRRTFWRNDCLQQQRGNDRPQPQPTLDENRERHDDGQRSVINSAVVKDTLESPKDVAKAPSFQPKWPWDRLKKGRSKAAEKPSRDEPMPRDDSNKENITDHHDESADDHHQQQQPDQPLQCCIGSIFGMDVGGTLAKLCYFESHSQTTGGAANGKSYERSSSSNKGIRRRHSMDGRIQYNSKNYNNHGSGSHAVKRRNWVDHHLHPNHDDDDDNIMMDSDTRETGNTNSLRNQKNGINPTLSQINLRRVQSLVNFGTTIRSISAPKPNHFASSKTNIATTTTTTNDHTMALHRFYDFARRLDTYQTGTRDPNLSFYSKELDGSFHFIKFETRRMMRAMDLIRTHKLHYNIHEMGGTGGGAHKFAAIWQQQLGIRMKKQDELDSLVAGMQFVLSTVIGECYTFRPDQDDQARKEKNNANLGVYDEIDRKETGERQEQSIREPSPNNDTVCESVHETNNNVKTETTPPMYDDLQKEKEFRPQGDEWWWSRKVQRDSISASDSSTYPYLVVTIGTGVSILRVDGPRQYERVSGSTIGGGTYLGLIRLLTDVEDFDDVMRLAECGNPSKVDMMVGDIYGENSDALEKLGLPSNLVASSFGKLVSKDDPAAGLKQEDLARALLLMITNNIGQVAYLNAKIFQTPRIYFVGNFLRHNTISQRRLSYAINYWSKGEMEALFLEHEGYFGAMGAFLLAQDISVSDLTRNSVTKSIQLGSKPENLLHHRRSATISNY